MTGEPPSSEPGKGDTTGDFIPLPEVSSGGWLHALSHDVDRPERIGAFKILEVLGTGGMGVVYLAEQTEPVRRRVALKVIKLGMDTREVVARFEAERQALAMMSHPNIARVFEAGATPDGRPYFVMEHVPGLPITEYCDRHCLSISDRLKLFVKICEAVQHAHQKAVIHRDLKPDNVLVMVQENEHVPKIIDFGVARATNQKLTEKTFFTEHGRIIGTPEYMSPEQAEMSGTDVDTRTDIYSLGVLLYELLTGALPFESTELRSMGYAEIQRIIREVEPPRPSIRLSTAAGTSRGLAEKRKTALESLIRELRGDLDWVTMKAMDKDRTRRYPSASELAADVLRHLRHEPVLARPPSIPYRFRKFLRKHRARTSTAAVLALAVGGVLALAAYREQASFRACLSSAAEAVSARDVVEARGLLQVLEERKPGDPSVELVRRSVDDLERALRREQGEALLSESRKEAEAYFQRTSRTAELKEEWTGRMAGTEPWIPVWERDSEIGAWRQMAAARQGTLEHYVRAVFLANKALEALPAGSSELTRGREYLEEFFWKVSQETLKRGSLSFDPADISRMIATLGVGTYAKQMEGSATISIETVPPADSAYCFRLENREERLLPVPHEAGGKPGHPVLRIERVLRRDECPFRAGDRILRARGRQTHVPGDLARALAGAGAGEAVEAAIVRDGREITLSWIPFAAAKEGAGRPESPYRATLEAGRLIDIPLQLGFILEGYPLELVDSCRLPQPGQGAFEIELPRGDYLLLLRKRGFADTRLPLSLPADGGRRKIRLLEESDIPDGFVYVPSGRIEAGADADAYEGLPREERELPGFLMKRLEVTIREYLEFLNDPQVLSRTDASGAADCAADWDQEALRPFRPSKNRVQLSPLWKDSQALLTRDPETKTWSAAPRFGSLDWPALGVSMAAAVEYAHWLGTKTTGGRRWRYRLPSELEWERAARGADRRVFVWGDYPVWPYCRSAKGRIARSSSPGEVGLHPADESVFGIRDLAGSVSEPTTGRHSSHQGFFVLKGGSWETNDDRDFRIGSRNRRLSASSLEDTGIRLVIELDPDRGQ